MSRSSTLIIFGVLTLLIPFLGVPSSVRSFLSIAFGACVIAIGFSLRTRELRRAQPPAEMPVTRADAKFSSEESAIPHSVSPI